MGRVKLWHGTTLDRAEHIREQGFRPANISTELNEVAARFDVSVDLLRRTLRDHDRHVEVQEVRADLTWLASSRSAAEGWAARAPEVRWEALWGVWWLTRDADDPHPWRSSAAAGWHAQQLFGVEPGVLELDVPITRVLGAAGERLAPGEVRSRVRRNVPELSMRPPGDVGWISSVHPSRRPVEFTAVAGLFRISTDDLVEAVKRRRVPEPRPGPPGMDWTWFEDELANFVPNGLLNEPI